MRDLAFLEVRVHDFQENIRKLREKTQNKEILFMVKANAYGHGAIEMTRLAYDKCEIKHFGCATVKEALRLRQALAPRKFELYVFSENALGDISWWKNEVLGERITPVIWSLKQFKNILREPVFKNIPLVLKFNTGMNRLGIGIDEQEEVILLMKKYERFEIEHLMSHLSSSGNPHKDDLTKSQMTQFQNIKEKFQNEGIQVYHSSISNSGAIERGLSSSEDFVRPGLLAYGGQDGSDLGLKNISSLKGRPLELRSVQKGDIIGYGGLKSPRNGVLAILPLGYADGLSFQYRGASCQCGKYRGEVVGHVNMDMTFILFPEEARKSLDSEEIIIWNHDVKDFLNLAKKLKLLPYHIFCQISARVPRKYI